jgi:hypothetical protein
MRRQLTVWKNEQAELRRVSRLECENWNLKHPVGTHVSLRNDSGKITETKTRGAAFVSESGHAVCYFDGVCGYYLLARAMPITAPAAQEGEKA